MILVTGHQSIQWKRQGPPGAVMKECGHPGGELSISSFTTDKNDFL